MSPMANKKPTKTRKPTNQDRATVALIFGVASLVTFLFWFFGLLFGILAIAFAIAAFRAKQDAGRAVAGILLGVSGMLLTGIVLIILTIAAPKTQQSQTDSDRESEMTSLTIQIENHVSNDSNALITPSDLSIQGFKVIKSIGSDKPATKTNVLFESGKFCDGTVNESDYRVTVLMDDGTPYCTGYKQTN